MSFQWEMVYLYQTNGSWHGSLQMESVANTGKIQVLWNSQWGKLEQCMVFLVCQTDLQKRSFCYHGEPLNQWAHEQECQTLLTRDQLMNLWYQHEIVTYSKGIRNVLPHCLHQLTAMHSCYFLDLQQWAAYLSLCVKYQWLIDVKLWDYIPWKDHLQKWLYCPSRK